MICSGKSGKFIRYILIQCLQYISYSDKKLAQKAQNTKNQTTKKTSSNVKKLPKSPQNAKGKKTPQKQKEKTDLQRNKINKTTTNNKKPVNAQKEKNIKQVQKAPSFVVNPPTVHTDKNHSEITNYMDGEENAIIEDSQYILNNKVVGTPDVDTDNDYDDENTKENDNIGPENIYDHNKEEEKKLVNTATEHVGNNYQDNGLKVKDIENEEAGFIDDNNFYCIFLIDAIMEGKEKLKEDDIDALQKSINDLYNSLVALSTVDVFFMLLLILLKNRNNISIKNQKIYLNDTLLAEFVDKNIYYYDVEKDKKYLLVFTEDKCELLQQFVEFFAQILKSPAEDNIFFLLMDLLQEVKIKSFITEKEKVKILLPVNISNGDPSLEKLKNLKTKKKKNNGLPSKNNKTKKTSQKQKNTINRGALAKKQRGKK